MRSFGAHNYSVKHALSAKTLLGPRRTLSVKVCGPNSKYQTCVICWSLATLLRPQSTKYALSVNVRRSFVAHNSSYETCVVGRSLAMLLLPKSTRYTLSIKVRRSFVAHNSSVKYALLAEVRRHFCGPDLPNMRYRWKCGEVLWPVTPSMKHALPS